METLSYPFCYARHKTRVVPIGDLRIGGTWPILIQSMLSSSATESVDCLNEIKSLLAVDCKLIRLAIPSQKALGAIPELRRLMVEEGISVPLVADIHFSPTLAIEACELFEKVRVNPGNYSDIPKNSRGVMDGDFFEEGRQKLKELIQPLVTALKKHNRALRIGVNQGSLSRRMIERYGDSPEGMAHSALEMVELFERQTFKRLVISLKSSNPIVVQRAYRLLIRKQPESEAVPLHLGVTEAGNGMMGRIKSLVGIGALLADGIGDTIRVSLTEPVANEILFARQLLSKLPPATHQEKERRNTWQRPLNHGRITNRSVTVNASIIGNGEPLKIGGIDGGDLPKTDIPLVLDFFYSQKGESYYLKGNPSPLTPLTDTITTNLGKNQGDGSTPILVKSENPLSLLRKYYRDRPSKKRPPIGMLYPIETTANLGVEIQMASILSEGLLDYLLVPETINQEQLTRMLLLSQATRSRIFVTDYIICPSCGRTLFDLERTAERIKKRTDHLKGLKIGVMGCVVNGPGEMADADFGYVGSAPGKIDLYFGQERVRRGIPEENAVTELINLIKRKRRWKDPE